MDIRNYNLKKPNLKKTKEIISLGMSIGFHLFLLVLIAFFYHRAEREEIKIIKITLDSEPEQPDLVTNLPEIPPITEKNNTPEVTSPPLVPVEPANASNFSDTLLAENKVVIDSIETNRIYEILTGLTDKEIQLRFNRHQFQERFKTYLESKLDSARLEKDQLHYAFTNFMYSNKELKRMSPKKDFLHEKQMQRNLGDAPGMVNLGPVFSVLGKTLSSLNDQKEKYNKSDLFKSPPNRLELYVLKHLWLKRHMADFELYSKLDTSYVITGEGFNHMLEAMTEKGWLKRKIVSPQRHLGFVTPVGIVPVEVFSQNKKNRIYEYEPLVSQYDVLQAFNFALLELKERKKSSPDSNFAMEKSSIEELLDSLGEIPGK